MSSADWAVLAPAVAGLLVALTALIRSEVANRRLDKHAAAHQAAATSTARSHGGNSVGT